MEMNSNKKMEWKNPKLIDLSKGKAAYGECIPGSGNVPGLCNLGGLATECNEGANAFGCGGGAVAVF